MLTQIII